MTTTTTAIRHELANGDVIIEAGGTFTAFYMDEWRPLHLGVYPSFDAARRRLQQFA